MGYGRRAGLQYKSYHATLIKNILDNVTGSTDKAIVDAYLDWFLDELVAKDSSVTNADSIKLVKNGDGSYTLTIVGTDLPKNTGLMDLATYDGSMTLTVDYTAGGAKGQSVKTISSDSELKTAVETDIKNMASGSVTELTWTFAAVDLSYVVHVEYEVKA